MIRPNILRDLQLKEVKLLHDTLKNNEILQPTDLFLRFIIRIIGVRLISELPFESLWIFITYS
jgi:hypothetical protein